MQTLDSSDRLLNVPLISKIIDPANQRTMISLDVQKITKEDDLVRSRLNSSLQDDTHNIIFIQDLVSDTFYKTQLENCALTEDLRNYGIEREKIKDRLAAASLVEFIQTFSDGSFFSEFVSLPSAQAGGCYYQGIYYDENAAQKLNQITKHNPKEVLPIQAISMKKANELFQKAINMKDIAWLYRYDGCFARAHLMARRFEAEGIRVDKAWITGELFVPETDIVWNFHVAPLVYVEDQNGKIQKVVIDPSIADRPITLQEWDSRVGKSTKGGSIQTGFPFPENAAFYERAALAISTSDYYFPGDSNQTEEMRMNHAINLMEEYLAEGAVQIEYSD